MRYSPLLLVLIAAATETGCGAKLPSVKPFKMEIQQGNVVTSKMLLQLRPGMTRSQVRYIMGTPLVVDSFRDNRWDYFYELRKQGVLVEKRRVILDFDKDSLLSVRGDVIPSDDGVAKEVPPETKPQADESSWTESLMFWKSKDVAAPSASSGVATEPVASAAPATSTAPVIGAEAKVETTAPAAPAQPQLAASERTEEEVVPYIPEGEYTPSADPAPAEMASQTPSVTSAPEVEAASRQQAVVSQSQEVSEPALIKAGEKAAMQIESASLQAAAPTVQATPPTAHQIDEPSVVAARPAVEPDDEVIPFIPEGEYVEPVIPTPEEMEKGNLDAQTTQPVEAETKVVTEKGMAPVNEKGTLANAEPVFESEVVEPAVTDSEPEGVSAPAEASLVSPEVATQTPVPMSVPAAKPIAQPQLPTASVEEAVKGWAQAWRSKNVKTYLAAYASDFAPEGFAEKAAWEAQRKQRLSDKQGRISLELGDLHVIQTGEEARVVFTQKYAAKAYRDEVIKTLKLRYAADQQRWMIVRETVAGLSAPVAAESSSINVSAATPVATPSVPDTESAVETTPLKETVERWAQAWRSKNISGYLASYAPDFVPDGLPSKRAWEAQRKQRLSTKQGPITLELGALNIDRRGANATVVFSQKYASSVYSDSMMKKLELRLDPVQNTWLIVRETKADVATLPMSAPVVSQPESSVDTSNAEPEMPAIGF